MARLGLEIGAIKLRPDDPFQWASGYRMPVYNDNRMFLFHPEARRTIARGFSNLMDERGIAAEVVAGTATAGIPHGALLADLLSLPYIYIRDKPKAHGLQNRIEGLDAESDLGGRTVVVIEDLISTGGSSARAVQAVREAAGVADWCLSIFSYGPVHLQLRAGQGRRALRRPGPALLLRLPADLPHPPRRGAERRLPVRQRDRAPGSLAPGPLRLGREARLSQGRIHRVQGMTWPT
jgi:orotate phosphoribosyltransferase